MKKTLSFKKITIAQIDKAVQNSLVGGATTAMSCVDYTKPAPLAPASYSRCGKACISYPS